MIKQLFKKGSSKLETVKSGNNIYVVIKAMTGKGLHSKCNAYIIIQMEKVCSSLVLKIGVFETTLNARKLKTQ